MKQEIRVEWGQWCHYVLPQLTDPDWSGSVEIKEGVISAPMLVTYYGNYGARTETKTPMSNPQWNWKAMQGRQPSYNRMGGIVFTVEAAENVEISIITNAGIFPFTLKQVLKDKQIVFHVGDRYSCNSLRVTLDGYNAFSMLGHIGGQAGNDTTIYRSLFHPKQFINVAGLRDWFRMKTAWMDAEHAAYVGFVLGKGILHKITGIRGRIQVHPARKENETSIPSEVNEEVCAALLRLRIIVNEKVVCNEQRAFAAVHKIPILEEIDFVIPGKYLRPENTLRIEIDSKALYLVISYMLLEGMVVKRKSKQIVRHPKSDDPVYIGFDTTLLPPERVAYFINKSYREKYANFVYFRFATRPRLQSLRQSASLLKKYRMGSIVMGSDDEYRVIKSVAGDLCLGFFYQESDGDLWGYSRMAEPASCKNGARRILDKINSTQDNRTMKQAQEEYMSFLRCWWNKMRSERNAPIAATCSVIGCRHAYKAGASFVFGQLNKSHNMLLMADVRGAAKENGNDVWGSHCAENSFKNPAGEEDLRMWYLSLYVSYYSGAKIIYDEEAAHKEWFEYLYSEHDYFPRRRCEIMKDFYKFTKYQSRKGEKIIDFAVMTGNYSCDCTDGIEFYGRHDPEVKVWGTFGGDSKQWRYAEPEYGFELVRLFYPQAYTQSLRGNPEPTRKWWSGSPHGEFDMISSDVSLELMKKYKFIFIPGWNTMTASLYSKIGAYIANGGELFMSLPQFAVNEDRRFLLHPNEMRLFRNGDLTDLCGLRVVGRGGKVNHIIADYGNEKTPYCVNQSSYAGHPFVYGAKLQNGNSHIIACDDKNQPILIENQVGKGKLYLLTTWNHHGNTRIRPFIADFLMTRIRNASSLSLSGEADDIYYAQYHESATGIRRFSFINTDWTSEHNAKAFAFTCKGHSAKSTVVEGSIKQLLIKDDLVIEHEDPYLFVSGVEAIGDNRYKISLKGEHRKQFRYYRLGKQRVRQCDVDFNQSFVKDVVINTCVSRRVVF